MSTQSDLGTVSGSVSNSQSDPGSVSNSGSAYYPCPYVIKLLGMMSGLKHSVVMWMLRLM